MARNNMSEEKNQDLDQIDEFLKDNVNLDFDEDLMEYSLDQVEIPEDPVELGMDAQHEKRKPNSQPELLKPASQGEFLIDAVIDSMETTPKPFPGYSASPADTKVTKEKIILEQQEHSHVVEVDEALNDYLMNDFEDRMDNVNFINQMNIDPISLQNTVQRYITKNMSFMVDYLAKVRSEFLIQVNIFSTSFIDGDQLLLINKDGIEFDINKLVVRINGVETLRFNVMQNEHDISYDFSAIGAQLIPTTIYERVLKAIAFQPSPKRESEDIIRSVSLQIIDDTGLSKNFVTQYHIELD